MKDWLDDNEEERECKREIRFETCDLMQKLLCLYIEWRHLFHFQGTISFRPKLRFENENKFM